MNTIAKRVLQVAGVLVTIPLASLGWILVRFPDAQPPSTETIQATPEQLERGRYLARHVADCLGCHSEHALDRFSLPIKPGTEGAGGLTFDQGMGVPGKVTAQNITPDPDTGIGRWTDGEILRAVREGVSRDGHALFPMMPYLHYRSMADDDARAVVAYLRTLAPINHATPPRELDFPVSFLVRMTPKPVAPGVSRPVVSDTVAYGKYLATIAGCVDCHTVHDDRGQLVRGREFAGGWVMKGPWGTVVSTNITPHPNSYVGSSMKDQFIARFKSYADMTAETAPEAVQGANTAMPWIAYAGMTNGDLGAIYDYLRSLPPIENDVLPFPERVKPPPAQ